MLGGVYNKLLSCKRVVLASQSPRRIEILKDLLLLKNVISIPTYIDENIDKQSCISPEDYVKKTCLLKINASLKQLGDSLPDVLIGADTIVVLNDEIILEKPLNKDNAIEMMKLLSGKSHKVMTAVGVAFYDQTINSINTEIFVETTLVCIYFII